MARREVPKPELGNQRRPFRERRLDASLCDANRLKRPSVTRALKGPPTFTSSLRDAFLPQGGRRW
jgi:hypothetical protein